MITPLTEQEARVVLIRVMPPSLDPNSYLAHRVESGWVFIASADDDLRIRGECPWVVADNGFSDVWMPDIEITDLISQLLDR